MPYKDAKYPPVKAPGCCWAALRDALAAFEELDMGWRELDATYVDQLVATNRHVIEKVLYETDCH